MQEKGSKFLLDIDSGQEHIKFGEGQSKAILASNERHERARTALGGSGNIHIAQRQSNLNMKAERNKKHLTNSASIIRQYEPSDFPKQAYSGAIDQVL